MIFRFILFLLISNVCLGQPDVLFEEFMENRTILGTPDVWDSTQMTKIITHFPSSKQASFCKAYFAILVGDVDLSQRLIDPLLKEPGIIGTYSFILRGLMLEGLGDAQEAMNNYNKALNRTPGFLMALAHRGLLNYHMDNLFAAESDFKQILMIKGDDIDFLLNLAAVKLAQNDLENSFELFKKVADAASGNVNLLSESYSGMAHVKLLAFEYQESVNLYQNAIKYNPQNANAYYEMGLTKKYLNDIAGGCADLLTAKQMGITVTNKEMKGCKRKK